MKNNIRTLTRTFFAYRWHLVVLALLGFLGAILEGVGINAAIPLLSFLVNGSGPADFISLKIQGFFHLLHLPFTFRYLLGFILTLFMLRAASVVLFGYIRARIGSEFLTRKTDEMLHYTFAASWPFLLQQKLGHVHNVLIRDVQRTSNLLDVLGQVIQSFSGFLMYLVVALNISLITTLSTLVAGAVLLGVVRPLMRKMQQTGGALAETEKNISHFVSEHVMGMKMLKAAAVSDVVLVQGTSLLGYLQRLYVKMSLIRSLSTSLFQPFGIIFVVILFFITYHAPGFSLISFAATLYLIQKIFTYLESGQSSLNSLGELIPYAESLERFKQLLIEHQETVVAGSKSFSFTKKIEFIDVILSYQGNVPALQGTTFTIEKGNTVGLIGPSGAGKSSVADLLLRLFEPTGGKILVDGEVISDIAIDAWRENIGYVSQDIFLLNASLAENIRFYRKNVQKEEIEAAARKANIFDFITSLPHGFDTVIGDRGVMLSGGQRQRVVLARALATNPAILVLDEATSALDTESEVVVQQAIQELRGNITVFIIAHRLRTIESVDHLVVLEKGRVVEQGTPEELQKTPGSYYARAKAGH